ncbi:MAG: DUF3810 domain-containing protein [Lachnospiraceae bacterium]|nr:DUF3810 domain-containing protein [Lachnospiraceae bacterium]
MKQWYRLKRCIWLILFPLSAFCLWIAKGNTDIAEDVFARGIYPVYSRIISWVSSIFPFSVAEVGVILLPIIGVILIGVWIGRLIKRKEGRKDRFIKGVLNIACVVAAVFFMFSIGCGVNYYRHSFAYYSGLTIEPSTKEDLYDLCVKLADTASELRSQIKSTDEDGVYQMSFSISELRQKTRQAMLSLGNEYEVLADVYPAAKPMYLFSGMMSRMELTGIYIPFTMEANVNIAIPHYSIASTMCHELAHLHGFMREDEANYISYLACMASDDIEIQYSGTMEALINAGNALYEKDASLYMELRKHYSESVVLDLRANSEYWKQYENTTISNIANQVNDTYLKTNNQEDGVQSYGRMVDLLLAAYRKQKLEQE